MSNKTQLQTNNTVLDALITRVSAAKDVAASLPEAGSDGSGGSVETCTVVINHPFIAGNTNECINSYFATTYIDGQYSADYALNGVYTSQVTISNVICGTVLYIYSMIDSCVWGFSTDKAEVLENGGGRFIIKATASAGETATITIYDDD